MEPWVCPRLLGQEAAEYLTLWTAPVLSFRHHPKTYSLDQTCTWKHQACLASANSIFDSPPIMASKAN